MLSPDRQDSVSFAFFRACFSVTACLLFCPESCLPSWCSLCSADLLMKTYSSRPLAFAHGQCGWLLWSFHPFFIILFAVYPLCHTCQPIWCSLLCLQSKSMIGRPYHSVWLCCALTLLSSPLPLHLQIATRCPKVEISQMIPHFIK